MANIREFIQSHLLAPLKQYPTVIQDTMLDIIADNLEKLYEYTWRFPEIVSPNSSRLDILKAIADQFVFTVREDADIEEQINILNNILYVYNRRGSIDTIEHMWKYYGGTLPKDVKVIIPSYNLFRYSISPLSGTHAFIKSKSNSIVLDTPAPEDIPYGSTVLILDTMRYIVTTGVSKGSTLVYLANVEGLEVGNRVRVNRIYEGTIQSVAGDSRVDKTINRSGVYEIKLTNNTYPIPDLRDFLIKELVAAGNEIYFTNELHMDVSSDIDGSNSYYYNVYEDTYHILQLSVLKSHQGLTWSGHNPMSKKSEDSAWSGRGSIYLELSKLYDLGKVAINTYKTYLDLGFNIDTWSIIGDVEYSEVGDLISSITSAVYVEKAIRYSHTRITNHQVLCAPEDPWMNLTRSIYDNQGNIVESNYPGYFILGETLLGNIIV